MSGRTNIPPTNQSYPPEFNPNLTNEVTPLARQVNYENSRHLPSAYVGDNQPPQALNVTPTSNRSDPTSNRSETGGHQPYPYPLITNVNSDPNPEFISNQEAQVPNVLNGVVQARVVPRIINQQRISNATRLEREAVNRRMMLTMGQAVAAAQRRRRRAAQNQQPVNPETPPGTPPPERNNENGPPYRPRTPPNELHNSESERRGPTPQGGGKGKTKKNKNTKKSKKTKKTKKNKKNKNKKNKTKRKTICRRK